MRRLNHLQYYHYYWYPSIFGIDAIVWSFVIAQIISSLLVMYLVSYNLNYRYLTQILVVLSLLAIAIVSYSFIEWSNSYLIQYNEFTKVLIKLFGFSSIYFSLLFIFKKNIKKIYLTAIRKI